ncbi:hypothetical protein [Streptomyces coffeae]|uniref:Uncharacterized protein n=1 Tax=Streptomyces coffeae TaxID=621382 RepID=A0ABS1NB87_9ACTN|nr:hypothetical protein [Streptomyces coffeae]MBL1097337.1 hypothetical protein [Streptomyces coffeae]
MAVRICSLIVDVPQLVPADGTYHVVRFPYGREESYDPDNMHPARQPDGHIVGKWRTDDRSGLIWPSVDGWGALTAMVQWEKGTYTELRDRFVRDPLGLSTGADATATDHRPPSPGMQCFTKHHQMFVHPDVPLALVVAHNDRRARRLVFAEFKLAVHGA